MGSPIVFFLTAFRSFREIIGSPILFFLIVFRLFRERMSSSIVFFLIVFRSFRGIIGFPVVVDIEDICIIKRIKVYALE